VAEAAGDVRKQVLQLGALGDQDLTMQTTETRIRMIAYSTMPCPARPRSRSVW